MLISAAILIIFLGGMHSYLGEKYILIRLFKHAELPRLYGTTEFTKQVLRLAWHITTLAWLGFAAILMVLADSDENLPTKILLIISGIFTLSGLTSLIFSRGKHLSWIVFFAIAILSYYSAIGI